MPAELRRKYGLKNGSKVIFVDSDNKLIIEVADRPYFNTVAGVFGLKGKHLKSLMNGKRDERLL